MSDVVKIFKTSKEFELLERMNAVQHSVIVDLQKKNQDLEEKIQHLETLLKSLPLVEIK